MAHQIFQDRRMFYSGETPWHGLGTKLPSNATWADIAPMFPDVHELPIAAAGGLIIPDMKALVCSGDGRYLATVGADYSVIQASEIASAIIEAAKGEGAVFHTGGLLGDRGARGWLMGELPDAKFKVDGDNSEIRAYFTGLWGHDGRTPVRLLNNSTRVVCANTVAAALGERGNFRATIRHTSGAADALASAVERFKALRGETRKLQDFANTAAATPITRDQVMAALDTMFPAEKDASVAQIERRDASMGKVVSLLQSPTVAPAHRGTAWGLMQAMTEFDQHFTARMTDAQKQIDAIAARQIDGSMMGDLAAIYSNVASIAGIALPL